MAYQQVLEGRYIDPRRLKALLDRLFGSNYRVRVSSATIRIANHATASLNKWQFQPVM